MLKDTAEYADVEDKDILKSIATKKLKGSKGIHESYEANKRSRVGSADPTLGRAATKAKINNDWIPTEAVRAVLQIQEEFKG